MRMAWTSIRYDLATGTKGMTGVVGSGKKSNSPGTKKLSDRESVSVWMRRSPLPSVGP